MIKELLSFLFLLTSIPVGLILNYYTKDEKYLKNSIKYLTIILTILFLTSLFLRNTLISLTLAYMTLISIISYIKKR